MSNNIEGKVVVITGASSSLGEATARCSPRRTQALYWARGASSGLKSLADKLTDKAKVECRAYNRGGGNAFVSVRVRRPRDRETR